MVARQFVALLVRVQISDFSPPYPSLVFNGIAHLPSKQRVRVRVPYGGPHSRNKCDSL